jgi:tRNA A-37 threonylcarbamoyl transferase component Bud32
VVSLAAYGSQVAGYSKPKSDYDLILVKKPFYQRIKYFYLKGEVDCAVLVIHPKTLENDCRKSSLGEFVSGRLLNPFFPITGKDFLKELEIAYKKRVVVEGLSRAYAEYEQFASEIIFPLSYFLFDKLKRRAAIYPPVVYSYSRTYSDELCSGNLSSSLDGFKAAALELQREKIVSFDEGRNEIKISPNIFHGGLYARIGAAASFTSKSLRQYAIHGYAGRVNPNVVGREVISKISRSRKSGKLPEKIRNPKKEWSLPEGELFISSEDWLQDLAEMLGLGESYKVTEKSLGEVYTTAGFYTFENPDHKNAVTIAVKRYKDMKGMKWGVLGFWSLKNAHFTANPTERLYREYRGSRELRSFGLATPDVIAVFLRQRMIVTRFVYGKDLSKIETAYLEGRTEDLVPLYDFGRDLAVMHNHGYCMGDTKPSNAILSDEDSRIYFADLEQAHPDGNKTWDVAEFIYYSVRFTLKEDRARKLVNSFVQGYLSKCEDPSILESTATLRYTAPFQAFIAPNVLNAVKRDLTD